MKRSAVGYLRERLAAATCLLDGGYANNAMMISVALIATDAWINIAESLEAIAETVERYRWASLTMDERMAESAADARRRWRMVPDGPGTETEQTDELPA